MNVDVLFFFRVEVKGSSKKDAASNLILKKKSTPTFMNVDVLFFLGLRLRDQGDLTNNLILKKNISTRIPYWFLFCARSLHPHDDGHITCPPFRASNWCGFGLFRLGPRYLERDEWWFYLFASFFASGVFCFLAVFA